MKARALRDLSMDELLEKEKELKKELFNLKMQLVTGRIENPSRIGKVKRDTARVKTIINEKKHQALKQQGSSGG